MSVVDRAVVPALPWLSAAGALVMTGVAVVKWKTLDPVDRVAVGVDAVAYAVASLPLARRRSAGWRTLYLATVTQPVFAAVDVAWHPPRWCAAIGRTAGAAAAVVLLNRVRNSYE